MHALQFVNLQIQLGQTFMGIVYALPVVQDFLVQLSNFFNGLGLLHLHLLRQVVVGSQSGTQSILRRKELIFQIHDGGFLPLPNIVLNSELQIPLRFFRLDQASDNIFVVVIHLLLEV